MAPVTINRTNVPANSVIGAAQARLDMNLHGRRGVNDATRTSPWATESARDNGLQEPRDHGAQNQYDSGDHAGASGLNSRALSSVRSARPLIPKAAVTPMDTAAPMMRYSGVA